MPSYINTNINSLNVQMALNASQSQQSTAMQRLATGLRINSAADDAAGFAISTRMTSQIGGDTQAARNANDGISLAQTAGGDLTQITNNLQTMRDLAVQSANATNSASDRAALNNQLQALSAEIQRVSQTSAFNGVNLLDGTFATQVFQVGANSGANNQIQISSIASASTSALGAASLTSQSTVAGTATTAALVAGDLTLNGAQVGASVAGTAPGQNADSASSVATAINNVSGTSGVTATANATVVTGNAASAYGTVTGAIAAGTFSINGVNVGAIAGGGNAQGQGVNVAAAINQISAQTGVTATANATTGALTLTAADGRDINIDMTGSGTSTTSAASQTTFLAQTGLAAVNVGAQAYAATAGTQLIAGTTFTPFFSTAGGTIAANTITANGVAVGAVSLASQAYAAGATAASAAAGSTLTIGNLTAGDTYTIASTTTNVGTINLVATGNAATDAANFAAAYNALGTTQFTAGTGLNANVLTSSVGTATLAITAVRTAAQVSSGLTATQAAVTVNSATSAANAAGFVLNAGTLGTQNSGGAAYNGQQLATAIQTALTTAGSTATVSASPTSGQITTAVTAISIGLGGTAASAAIATANQTAAATATGLTATQLGTQAVGGGINNTGTVTLTSTNAAGIVIGGANAAKAGLTIGTTAPTTTSTVNSVANINISTAAGATAALAVIDGALSQVATSQAALGAIQNRFASVVTSLQTTSTNLTAAQSRIQDTDYAATTAMLSRTQILQQAGNAMLAQANQLPNQVLTLLR